MEIIKNKNKFISVHPKSKSISMAIHGTDGRWKATEKNLQDSRVLFGPLFY